MKKMILLLIVGGLTFSTVNAQLQQSDTIKSGNGTTIINIGLPTPPKKNKTPNKDVPPTKPTTTEKDSKIYYVFAGEESFLSKNGATWWLIILSLVGMAMLVAILFLVGRNRSYCVRCNCGFNSCCCNGCVQHNGNLNHSGNVSHNGNIKHSGTVEHKHTYPEPVTPAASSAAEGKNDKV